MDTTTAVRHAIDKAPCSLRRLAEAAGVDHSTLVRIRSGERQATRDVAWRVRDALAKWASDCRSAERAIRRAMRKERPA